MAGCDLETNLSWVVGLRHRQDVENDREESEKLKMELAEMVAKCGELSETVGQTET